jgi:hypothetical protein
MSLFDNRKLSIFVSFIFLGISLFSGNDYAAVSALFILPFSFDKNASRISLFYMLMFSVVAYMDLGNNNSLTQIIIQVVLILFFTVHSVYLVIKNRNKEGDSEKHTRIFRTVMFLIFFIIFFGLFIVCNMFGQLYKLIYMFGIIFLFVGYVLYSIFISKYIIHFKYFGSTEYEFVYKEKNKILFINSIYSIIFLMIFVLLFVVFAFFFNRV